MRRTSGSLGAPASVPVLAKVLHAPDPLGVASHDTRLDKSQGVQGTGTSD